MYILRSDATPMINVDPSAVPRNCVGVRGVVRACNLYVPHTISDTLRRGPRRRPHFTQDAVTRHPYDGQMCELLSPHLLLLQQPFQHSPLYAGPLGCVRF